MWSGKMRVEPGKIALAMANLSWSKQRKTATGIAAGSAALAVAGLVTGLLAFQADSSLDGMPTTNNAERAAYQDRLDYRDELSLATNLTFGVMAAGLVTAACMYWFDMPEAPSSRRTKKQTSQRDPWTFRLAGRGAGLGFHF